MEIYLPLPIELVLNVMTCLLPPNERAILRPSDPITKTLLAFTLVCHETQRLATRLLLKHCVHLSSSEQLRSCLLSVVERPHLHTFPSAFLAPFTDTIDDPPVANWLQQLLCYNSSSLRRLVLDIPFRSLYLVGDIQGVRPLLRQGFQRLENLEECINIRDEVFLSSGYPDRGAPVWTCWPKLRRLAVYNPNADEDFWRSVALMPALEMVVLTRADAIEDTDLKSAYFAHTQRPLTVIFINSGRPVFEVQREWWPEWEHVDPEGRMTIMKHKVELLDDDPIASTQDWIKREGEKGTLWETVGAVVPNKYLGRLRSRFSW